MKKLLEELYWGNLCPNEQGAYSIELQNAEEVIEDSQEKLKSLLNDNEQKIVADLVTAYDDFIHIITVANFVNGFKLGSKLMLEITDG